MAVTCQGMRGGEVSFLHERAGSSQATGYMLAACLLDVAVHQDKGPYF